MAYKIIRRFDKREWEVSSSNSKEDALAVLSAHLKEKGYLYPIGTQFILIHSEVIHTVKGTTSL